jgi:hypothetical protein
MSRPQTGLGPTGVVCRINAGRRALWPFEILSMIRDSGR